MMRCMHKFYVFECDTYMHDIMIYRIWNVIQELTHQPTTGIKLLQRRIDPIAKMYEIDIIFYISHAGTVSLNLFIP